MKIFKRRPHVRNPRETPAHRAFIIELEGVRDRQKARKQVPPINRAGRPSSYYEFQGVRKTALEWAETLGLARRESFYTRLNAFKAGRCTLEDVFIPCGEFAERQQRRRREREAAGQPRPSLDVDRAVRELYLPPQALPQPRAVPLFLVVEGE